eukprot:5247066-Prorocentrum_lima.AAC.1
MMPHACWTRYQRRWSRCSGAGAGWAPSKSAGSGCRWRSPSSRWSSPAMDKLVGLGGGGAGGWVGAVSYTHLRAHETRRHL